jgi:protein-S-isoprenylcysteine O-methyltransferase Ste14
LFAVLFLHWQPIKDVVWAIEDLYFKIVFYAIFLTGCIILVHSIFVTGLSDLLGLRQVKLYFNNQPYAPLCFATPAAYKRIRHPMMLGTLIVFWATPFMTVGHFLLAAATTCYIVIGITFEERDLVDLYGEEYKNYKQRVGMFLPSVRRNS